jgi:divalent metal cation (Fe/Co/Zn/Cd) transporter
LSYGHRYVIAATTLAIASFSAFFNILNAQITTVFYAKGVPQLHRRCVAAMAITVVILTYPCIKEFGLWGAQLASLAAIVVGYVIQIERIRKVSSLSLKAYGGLFLSPAAVSLGAIAAFLGAKITHTFVLPWANLLFGIFCCIATYGSAYLLITRGTGEIGQLKGARV